MPRVKRGVTARPPPQRVSSPRSPSISGCRGNVFRIARQRRSLRAGQYASPRPPQQEAHLPRPVDHPHHNAAVREQVGLSCALFIAEA